MKQKIKRKEGVLMNPNYIATGVGFEPTRAGYNTRESIQLLHPAM